MDNNLKQLRKAKRVTQEQLADAIGATKRQVGAWERGENDLPMDYAYAIADVLGCTIDELSGRISMAVVSFPKPDGLSYEEMELIKNYRKCHADIRTAIRTMASSMAGIPDEAEMAYMAAVAEQEEEYYREMIGDEDED